MHKIFRYSYFYNEKLNRIYNFAVKLPSIRENSKNELMSQFSDKSDEKVAREKTYRLILEFYHTDRKMLKRHSTQFCLNNHVYNFHSLLREKISFKTALECFVLIDRHLGRALRMVLKHWIMILVLHGGNTSCFSY